MEFGKYFNRLTRSNSKQTGIDINKQSDTEQTKKSITNSSKNHDEGTIVKIRPQLATEGKYGLLAKIAETLSKGTEAHFEAILMQLLTVVSISIPRELKTLPFGANVTEHRVNSLIIAPTGGGKGLSDDQVAALIEVATNLASKEDKELPFPLYAAILSGGLSSGEGLSNHLRDSENPNSDDKRLVIIEAEFQSVLSKSHGKESILSATIRKLFDGKTLTSMTKSDPYVCSAPHVAIIGHMTPSELCHELSNSAIANGFANRFPVICLFRKKAVPFPTVTDKAVLESLARDLNDVMYWANSDSNELYYSDCYRKLYEEQYERLKSLGPDDSVEQKLMTRASHYATMYSMLFAICDKSNAVTAKHLEAALAWVDYWHSSIRYIFNTERAEKIAAGKKLQADKVLETIKKLSAASGSNVITKTPLSNALGKSCSAKELSEALRALQELPEPPIRVVRGKHNKHTIYLL